MGLDPSSRGAVEQMIDQAVKLVPDTTRIFKAQSMKSNFQISSESDFVLGVTYGRIMMSITTFWNLTHKRAMTGEELDEINNTVSRRMPEIHKAISNA
jgi:hypothetical protein